MVLALCRRGMAIPICSGILVGELSVSTAVLGRQMITDQKEKKPKVLITHRALPYVLGSVAADAQRRTSVAGSCEVTSSSVAREA